MDLLLQLVNPGLEDLLFVLELLFHLEYLDVDHLILLNLGYQLLLGQHKVLVDLLQLFLHLVYLLAVVAGEEAAAEVGAGVLLGHLVLLTFIF